MCLSQCPALTSAPMNQSAKENAGAGAVLVDIWRRSSRCPRPGCKGELSMDFDGRVCLATFFITAPVVDLSTLPKKDMDHWTWCRGG